MHDFDATRRHSWHVHKKSARKRAQVFVVVRLPLIVRPATSHSHLRLVKCGSYATHSGIFVALINTQVEICFLIVRIALRLAAPRSSGRRPKVVRASEKQVCTSQELTATSAITPAPPQPKHLPRNKRNFHLHTPLVRPRPRKSSSVCLDTAMLSPKGCQGSTGKIWRRASSR